MANLNAILKNKMGLSAEQAKKSKVLASLSGSYRQNMKSIHYTQLVSNINQFYSEKELENLADVIQILGGVAQNLLVRKKDAEQYEILAGHRRWRASQIVVQRGFPEYAYLPCLVIECNDDVAELLLILTNSSARNDLNGYEQMMQVVRLKELLPKINKDETLKGRILRKEIALSTKRSESTIQNLMFTAKHLSEDGMQAFREEKLTPAAALYLAKQSKEDQKDLVQKEFFTVAAMEGYLASKSVTQEIPSKQPTKEGKRNPNLKPCKTGLSKSGACGSAAYCEAPYSCCKECKKECSLRCGWIREEIDDIPEKHQGPEPYVAVPAEKTESKRQVENLSDFPEEGIRFTSSEHKKAYYDSLQKFSAPDSADKALCYCINLMQSTRSHVTEIFDFEQKCLKTECLKAGWQTSSSEKAIRMAFNLFSGEIPTVDYEDKVDNQLKECQNYTVNELFYSSFSPYFWQAVQLRYPEYTK